jgi:hypothetical protein
MMTLIITIGLVILLITIRVFEVYYFLKKLSKLCNQYDLKYINKHPLCAIDMIRDRDNYFTNCDWSAYNFVYLKGPSPRKMFLSHKPLTLESQYNKYVIDRLKNYEII